MFLGRVDFFSVRDGGYEISTFSKIGGFHKYLKDNFLDVEHNFVLALKTRWGGRRCH